MKNRWNSCGIEESMTYETFTVNKGEKIVMCLRNQQTGEMHNEINLLMFVAIHELAHVMSVTNHHTPEFWKNFKFLLDEAVRDDLYRAINYKYDKKWYCAMELNENPYYFPKTNKDIAEDLMEVLEISI